MPARQRAPVPEHVVAPGHRPGLRRWLPSSIAARVLAVCLITALAPVAVAQAQTWWEWQAAEQHAYDQARSAAGAASAEVSGSLNEARQAAKTIAWLPAFWQGADSDRDQILAALAAAQPNFRAILYYCSDLQQYGSSNYDPNTGRPDLGARGYAYEAIATGQLTVTDEALFPQSGGTTNVLPVAVPLRAVDAASRDGLLVAGLQVAALPIIWSDVSLLAGSELALVDSCSGRILAGTGRAAAGVNEQVHPHNLEPFRAGQLAWRSRGANGQDYLRALEAVNETPWIVAVGVRTSTVYRPIYAAAVQRDLLSVSVALVALSYQVVANGLAAGPTGLGKMPILLTR